MRPWSDGEFEALLEQDTVFGYAAREIGHGNEQPVGFVLARLVAGEGEILTIAVARGASPARAWAGGCMDAVLRELHAAARRSAVSRSRRNQSAGRSRSTGVWASAKSASARATYQSDGAARLSCAATFASRRRGIAAMIGRIRICVALLFVAVSTLVLVPLQLLSMKTGWFSENLVRGVLAPDHRSPRSVFGFTSRGAMSQKRPLLIASNHVSWTDVDGPCARSCDVSFIAKSEMAGWPVIGRLSRLQRPVFIERENRRKSGDQASEIARRLSRNRRNGAVSPKARPDDGNMLLPFKSTLFGAAAIADRRRRRARSTSSRSPSPIRASTAFRWAGSTGCLAPGSAIRSLFRTSSGCSARARSTWKCISASRSNFPRVPTARRWRGRSNSLVRE